MLFTQLEFVLLFLPAVLLLHESLRSTLARTRLLVLASILFYSAWDVRFLPMVLVSVLGNFAIGRALVRERSRRVLAGGIVFNLLPLAYCKYGAFLLDNVGIPVDAATSDALFPAAIPLGISFYTFQQIAYLVDVHRVGEAERSLSKYSFFTLFFPQLIAGPIVHHRQIIPQIGQPADRQGLFLTGIVYFVIGYVKKFLVADSLGAMVDPLYAADVLVFQQSLVATVGYTFQLYFDFSGYSDMAMGLGALFGFRLPVNFDGPYRARSITDFWRRWHITLSGFLRDYVYIPLGGNRHGSVRRYRNLLLTMLVGGLWHGAGWTFVLWGGAHGLLLAAEQWMRRHFPRVRAGLLARPLTFCLVALLWVPFRSETFAGTITVYRGFGHFTGVVPDGAMLALAACLVLVAAPSSHRIAARCDGLPRVLAGYLFGARRRLVFHVALSHLVVLAGIHAFYSTSVDRWVYGRIPIRTTTIGIDNTSGDFRSNLMQQEVLRGPERKVVFVGSSFTQELGAYRFDRGGERFKSGTIGIGGNNSINALRSAVAVMDDARLHTLVLGVSPLNLGPLDPACPFPGEGMAGVNELGFDIARQPLSEVDPVELGLGELLSLYTDSNGRRYRQLDGFIHNVGTSFAAFGALAGRPVEVLDLELASAARIDRGGGAARLATASRSVPVPDPLNGSDARFHWRERGILESIEAGGDFRRAIVAIRDRLAARGVRLVVYDTPTPSHALAPRIYPAGFLERYRQEMRSLTAELGVEYYDLTDLFPWSGEFMVDFIHPRPAARRAMHRLLLHRMFGEVP